MTENKSICFRVWTQFTSTATSRITFRVKFCENLLKSNFM